VFASRENFPLLDELLADQQRLDTPVAKFSIAHDSGSVAQLSTLSSQLIPLSAPGPGEHYAFEVELDSCTGCKACVAACHSLNGLDDTETWRDVGLVVGGDERRPFLQTVTTACHHCADPACLHGCPVLAFEKDPVTGIVRHLDDQCIGCQYCILKCPYDVPKYNARLGIVRKCDMCQSRLAHGEAPACAQACPTHAIRIVTVKTDEPAAASVSSATATLSVGAAGSTATSTFLPAAPDPAYTRPTTRYLSRRTPIGALRAADATALRLEPPHWPLVVLLTLMPMAIGCGIADKVLALPTPALGVAGWLAGVTGLALSVGHIGQPRRAWRIFLGLRRSWLSREAIVFGIWLPLATLYLLARLGWWQLGEATRAALASATAACGLGGLFCSVMIYADTRREFWRVASTLPRIFGTTFVLGLAGAYALAPSGRLAAALAAAVVAKLAFELRALRPLRDADPDDPAPPPAVKTARLLTGRLRPVFGARAVAGLVGGVLLPFLITMNSAAAQLAWLAAALALAGELAERYLFFRAVVAPKMPGVGAS